MVATIKDANNNVTTYQYDGFDRLDKVIYPDTSYEQNTYDANSNVLTFRTRGGNTITSTFDTLNRLKTETPQGLSTRTFTYDLAGRRTKTSTPVVAGNPTTGDYDYFFDTAGRFFKERNPDGKEVTYQLDPSGNVTKTTWPDGYFVDYVYDQLNRVTDVKLNGSGTSAAHFDYDPLSRRKKITYQNGCVTDYGYELDDDLNSLVQSFVGSSVAFTPVSNLVNQITSLSVSDSQFLWNPAADFVTAYGANNLNQYQTVSGLSMSYNTDGCLIGNGNWTYGYDSLNRLTSATAGSTSLSFLYDPDNRQAQKQIGTAKMRYIYDGMQRIADYDGVSGTLQTRYVYGTGIDEPLIEVSSGGTLTFFHHDRLGSIIARTNSAGAVLNRYAYGPYGETPSLTGTAFGYTGQRYDAESGLYYYKARYYSPALGRFLQPDPIGYEAGLNLYEYVGNDPLNASDPLGLAPQGQGPFGPSNAYFRINPSDLPGRPNTDVQQITNRIPYVKPSSSDGGGSCPSKDKEKEKEKEQEPGQPNPPSGGSNPWLDQAHAMEDEFRRKVATNIASEILEAAMPWGALAKIRKFSKVRSALKAWDVGTYKDLKGLKNPNGLVPHHVGQSHVYQKSIPGYNPNTAPTIAIDPRAHARIPTIKGATNLTPRQELARSIWDLRKVGAPREALQELIELNKRLYPGSF